MYFATITSPLPRGAQCRRPRPKEGSRLFDERRRIKRLSRVRELVFGSLDGLIVPLGVVSVAEIVVVGVVSASGGYVLGTWLPRLFGY